MLELRKILVSTCRVAAWGGLFYVRLMARDGVGMVIEPAKVEAYLRSRGFEGVELLGLHPLGMDTQAGLKAYGYGRPLRVTFNAGGKKRDIVIRTMSPDAFGHLRRSDRAQQMILCFDTFDTIPHHIHANDIGAFGPDGSLVSVPAGEPFLTTEYVEGALYALDLERLVHAPQAPDDAQERAAALARYLAGLHAIKMDAPHYIRHVRDLVGSGEGIFGQCDAYPDDTGIASRLRLRAIESEANRWRWKLHEKTVRCCRTHGDFHPFNILFRSGTDFSVLDCSRGGVGEAADDLTALSINYIFYALNERGQFTGALRQLWSTFWHTYVEATGDSEVLQLVAPYFAWRSLVVASPVWYPGLQDGVRNRLLGFAERLLGDEPFEPERVEALLK